MKEEWTKKANLNLGKTELVFVLSDCESLYEFAAKGILASFLSPYRQILPDLYGMTIVSLAGRKDMKVQERLGNIELVCSSKMFPQSFFIKEIAKKLGRSIARSYVIECSGSGAVKFASRLAQVTESPLIINATDFSINDRLPARNPFSFADGIIFSSNEELKKATKKYRIGQDHMHVVPESVDTKLFKPNPALPRRRGQVMLIGPTANEKTLRIFAQAVGQVTGARLAIIGDIPCRKSFENYVRKERLKVDMMGMKSYADLPSYFNSCEVFLYAPEHMQSPCSRLLQAMSCGACIIASGNKGAIDIIEDGKNGLVADLSVKSLSAVIKQCMNDPSLSGNLGRAARKEVKKFDIKKISAIKKEIYKSYLGERAKKNTL